ncbi:MAG TPA: MFS transporter [Alphaproteobacteria bacterium]|nr:MFS transporter [Alphaproteobacteria bacterium]
MVDIAGENIAANTAHQQTSESAASQYESDFSPRKLRVALVILLGQTFATSFLPYFAVPLALLPITKEFGWSPKEYSVATTSSLMWLGALSGVCLGPLVDRFGVRPILVLGSIAVALVTMSISLAHNFLSLFLSFGLVGFFGSTGMHYGKVTAALFNKNRGKALAILGAESAVAAAIAPQIDRYLIGTFGWRQSFVIEGLIILAIVPLLYFVIEEPGTAGGSRNLFKHFKRTPSDAPANREIAPQNLEGMTLKQSLTDKVFWLITLAGIIALLPRGALFTYFSPLFAQHGFNGQAATANFLSLTTAAGAIGALIAGFALDKVHDARLAIPFKLGALLSLILLGIATAQFGGMLLLMFAGMVWGVADGSLRPFQGFFQIRFFGLKSYGSIMGISAACMSIMLGIAAPVVGFIQEKTHSYDTAIWLLTGLLVFGAAIYLFLGPYRYSAMIGAVRKDSA